MKNKKNYNRGAMALSQIFILIFGMIAISYVLGSEVRVVSAAECSGTSEPTIEDGKVIFCHKAKDDSRKFTVIDEKTISRPGRTYTKEGEDWVFPGGKVNPELDQDWIDLANLAIEKYKSIQKTSSTSVGARTCIRYEIEGKVNYGVYEEIYNSPTGKKLEKGGISIYYKNPRGNPLASGGGTWYIWEAGDWAEIIGQNIKKAEKFSSSDTCDASQFPEEKEITNNPLEQGKTTTATGGNPFDYSSDAYWVAQKISKTTKETIPRATVSIGPPGGKIAVWQSVDGENWKCIEGCKILEDEWKALCTGGDCTDQTKNLCGHYKIRDYLLRKDYTNPPGNCDTGFFRLNNDYDGDGVADSADVFPKDPYKHEEGKDTNGKVNGNGEGKDTDGDTIIDEKDNCPNVYNKNQVDDDGDGIGNACDDVFNKDLTLKCKEKCKENEYGFGYCRALKSGTASSCEAGENSPGQFGCPTKFVCCCSNTEDKSYKEPKVDISERGTAPVFGGTDWINYLAGNIVEGAMWATGAYFAIKGGAGFFGVEEDLSDAWAMAFSGAVVAGKTVMGIAEAWNPALRPEKGAIVGKSAWFGAAVAVIYFAFAFRYETQEVITFNCQPWDASTGGNHCNECNNQGILPCSEYQCRSLGQGCELINSGTDEEKCAWVNRNDVEFPRIEAWDDALINEDYAYTPDDAISPPARGVKIVYKGGDIPAFTPLSFGIKLTNEDGEPEPAKCKFDSESKNNFEDMNFFFSDGLLLEEHSYILSLPGAGGDLEIENDGEYNVYVRCQDANGNENVANFVFSFNVNQGPDTTPPLIVTTDPINNMPFAFEQESFGVNVYMNEPVQGCKWSHSDKSYKDMEETMNCDSGNSFAEMNAQGLFACNTELNGLNDRVENKFYFRCEDLAGNINEESYEYTLIGTQPLVIDWVKPTEGDVISDSTDSIKVTLEARTSVGYDDGRSGCFFKDMAGTEDYTLFLGDNDYDKYEHKQELWLGEGDYEYSIKCVDLGGNEDTMSTTFSVEADGDAPVVVRAYYEDVDYLKLITNEPAECAYDTKYENYPCDFNFEDGTLMTTLEEVNHYTDWNTATTFYIKCQDKFGNQPWPDGCSIIVKPSDLY